MTTHLPRTFVFVTAIVVAAPAARAFAQGKGESQRSCLPAAVARVVEQNRPGAEIATLEIEKEAGITLYDIEFKDGRGEIEVAQDGTVLDVTDVIEMKDVPEAAAPSAATSTA